MGETWGPLEAGDRAEGVLSPLCAKRWSLSLAEQGKGLQGPPGNAILGLHLERGQ